MYCVLNTNIVSPHQTPLALALAKELGRKNFAYCYYTQPSDPDRSRAEYARIADIAINATGDYGLSIKVSTEANVLLENVRDFGVMEKRSQEHRKTFYISERWFKPIRVDSPRRSEYSKGKGLAISGFWKMCLPFAIIRAKRIVRLLNNRGNGFMYLPAGIHAAKDMARVCGLLNGDWRCLFAAPELDFEHRPCGRIWLKDEPENGARTRKMCLDKMRMWGYFVSSSNLHIRPRRSDNYLKLLWVGRLLSWKEIETIFKAIDGLSNVSLDVYGDGPERNTLIAKSCLRNAVIRFMPKIDNDKVREVMREHDIFVISSNSFEGWGAVVNEALEERMKVIGTYEAGASATILPETNLFHAGDWRGLRQLLKGPIPDIHIGSWTAENAAHELMALIDGLN